MRYLIIGGPGSGKTTFANKLGLKLDITVFSLDDYFWTDDWAKIDEDKRVEKLLEISNFDSWIIEGNYLLLLEILNFPDSIIFFDVSFFRSFFWIVKRFLYNKNNGFNTLKRTRPLDINIFWALFEFHLFERKKIIASLEVSGTKNKISWITNVAQIEELLTSN